jgi:predicted transposase/invertase (TIGR01784 family)
MKTSQLVSFDYAIKYLLKDKSGYEIVEGFLSALLQAEGYPPVKIKALLDTESNREEIGMKRSIADVIVEDANGNKYVVEIDRSWTKMFLHKACFNTSRLIVDSISSNEDYSTIKKVFHINILYEPLSDMKSPLYHGKTVIKEMGKEHPIDLHLEDMGGRMFDAHNVFPEYFIISVPLFNDVIKQELDEWLYIMKHSEVRSDFKSPYMAKVAKRLSILKMSAKELVVYNEYRNKSLKERDYVVSAEERGIEKGIAKGLARGLEKGLKRGLEKGIEKGERQKATTIAKNLLSAGIDIEVVSSSTGLDIEELKKLSS